MSSAIPITIITGFLGSGKTTLLLNLLPQLRTKNANYKVALLKNEFGDLAIDSQLATYSSSISGVREILNGCICCNLVGSISTALEELSENVCPNRIIIETSGSAFPATLAMEVNRLARETDGKYVLDGVITVIDVENWKGYEDTSFTARLQARYTDLIVFNKWEDVDERRWDECLDRLGDMEIEVAWVRSQRGWVDMDVIFGLDRPLAKFLEGDVECEDKSQHKHTNMEGENHQNEVEVLSVTLSLDFYTESNSRFTSTTNSQTPNPKIDIDALLNFLKTAPKDEIYRIKAILISSSPIPSSSLSEVPISLSSNQSKYILNWAFGRWTCTQFCPSKYEPDDVEVEHPSSVDIGQGDVFLRMIIILTRGVCKKWKRKLEDGKLVCFDDKTLEGCTGRLKVVSIT